MRALADLHNHLLAGVDDGARSTTESLRGMRALHQAGVRTIVVTPHVDASMLARPALREAKLDELDAAWTALQRVAAALPDLCLHRGAEVMLDLPAVELGDPRARLAGGRYVLVEFTHGFLPPNTSGALARIRSSGAVPVVAHPERYAEVQADPDFVRPWREAGACLQLNGGSLVGWYGRPARAAAAALLAGGLVDYVASDYHAHGRCPVGPSAEALAALAGEETRELLLAEHPSRVVRDEPLLEVPPVMWRKPLWRRMMELLR